MKKMTLKLVFYNTLSSDSEAEFLLCSKSSYLRSFWLSLVYGNTENTEQGVLWEDSTRNILSKHKFSSHY